MTLLPHAAAASRCSDTAQRRSPAAVMSDEARTRCDTAALRQVTVTVRGRLGWRAAISPRFLRRFPVGGTPAQETRRKRGRKPGRKRQRKHLDRAATRRAAAARPGRPRRRAARSLTPPGALGCGGDTRAAAAGRQWLFMPVSCRKQQEAAAPPSVSFGVSCAGGPPAGNRRRKRRKIAARQPSHPLTSDVACQLCALLRRPYIRALQPLPPRSVEA
jgi:hypothetical protein